MKKKEIPTRTEIFYRSVFFTTCTAVIYVDSFPWIIKGLLWGIGVFGLAFTWDKARDDLPEKEKENE